MISLATRKFVIDKIVDVNFFIKVFAIYCVFYALAEIPYISIMYTTPLNLFNGEVNFFEEYLSNLYKYKPAIYFLHGLKIFFLILIFFRYQFRIAVFFSLIINAIFLLLSHNSSPEQRYLNLILLVFLLYPDYLQKNDSHKKLKSDYYLNYVIWFIIGLSYTLSGFFKFYTDRWYSGNFIKYFIENNHVFNTQMQFLIYLPGFVLKSMTYFSMFAEMIALPLSIIKETRVYILTALTFMHISLLIIAEVYQITLGMLIVHYFLYLTLLSKNQT